MAVEWMLSGEDDEEDEEEDMAVFKVQANDRCVNVQNIIWREKL